MRQNCAVLEEGCTLLCMLLNKSATVKVLATFCLLNKLHKTHFCAPYFAPLACCARGQLPLSAPGRYATRLQNSANQLPS